MVVGFLPDDYYNDEEAEVIKQSFNAEHSDITDEFSPIMLQLKDQEFMAQTLAYMDKVTVLLLVLLILALSVVLWNTGLLSGIRRYNEFGVRIALGEEKGHLYRSLLNESLVIGLIGSILGTALGLLLCLYLSKNGIDYSSMMENMNIMIDPVIGAKIDQRMFWIGFIPGIISMLIGTALSGRAIYKRDTATLFKELD